MKRIADVETLHRHALATGAEVVMAGTHFNASRERVQSPAAATPRPVAAGAPAPPPPAVDAITREQLEAALAQRDRQWSKQLNAVAEAFKMAVAAIPGPGPAVARPREWVFTTTYDSRDRITETRATPLYDSED